ncbi:MAG: hypothetical protein WA691_05810 [Thermoplasmata archaeon]
MPPPSYRFRTSIPGAFGQGGAQFTEALGKGPPSAWGYGGVDLRQTTLILPPGHGVHLETRIGREEKVRAPVPKVGSTNYPSAIEELLC